VHSIFDFILYYYFCQVHYNKETHILQCEMTPTSIGGE